MMFKNPFRALGFVMVLAGCAQTPPANNLSERPELKVDPEVQHILQVTELVQQTLSRPAGRDMLQLQFAVEAYSDARFGWRVTWFDRNGMKVSGVGNSYREARVLHGQIRYFKATAPHPRVDSYQLHLREIR